MVQADFSGDYINAENTQDGDILTITQEAKYVEITKQDGTIRQILNVPVLTGISQKIYSPSRECGKAIIKAYGKETTEWIGKKLQAKIVSYKSFGVTKQMVECYPIA